MSTISLAKRAVWRYLLISNVVDEFNRVLKYPHSVQEVRNLAAVYERRGVLGLSNEKRVGKISFDNISIGFRVLNSENRFSEADRYFKQILEHDLCPNSIFRSSGFARYLMANFLSAPRGSKDAERWLKRTLSLAKFKPGYSPLFADSVSGRSISLVGAAPAKEPSGNNIDSEDLVVRINSNKLPIGVDFVGSRVDIVYVRSERGRYIIRNLEEYIEGQNSNNILYRFKNRRELRAFPLETASLSTNFDDVFAYGPLNAVQAALLDLLVHGARRVRIYNTDFNLTPNTSSNYRPGELKPVEYSKIFASHPPHTSFSVCQALYSLGLIDGDSEFCRLMRMELPEFLTLMETRHRP